MIEVVAVEAQHADGASWSTLPLLVSGMMTAGSVGVMSPHLLVYPVYFALINAVLTAAIGHRRAAGSRRKAQGARGLALAR